MEKENIYRQLSLSNPLIAPLLGLFLFLITVLATGTTSFIVGDSTLRYKQAIDFQKNGSFTLDYESRRLDPQGRFISYGFPQLNHAADGDYLNYPELFTLYGALMRSLGGDRLLWLVPTLPFLFSLFFLFRFFQELFPPRISFLVFLGSVFCTSLIIHAQNYGEIPVGLAFAHAGLFFHLQYLRDRNKYGNALLSGLCWGLAVFFRQEALIAYSLLLFWHYIIFDRGRIGRKILIPGLAFLFPALFFFGYNFILYKSPLGLRMTNLSTEQFSRVQIVLSLWFSNLIFKRAGVGLFGQMPFLLILFYRPISKFKSFNDNFRVLYLFGISMILVIPFFAPNDGYSNWGARYIMMADPALLAVFFHHVLGAKYNRPARILIAVAVGWSVLFSIAGIVVNGGYIYSSARLKEQLARRKENVILSSTQVHYMSGEMINKKHILSLTAAEDLPRFMDLLHRNNVGNFCLVAFKGYDQKSLALDKKAREFFRSRRDLHSFDEFQTRFLKNLCAATR